MKKNLFRKASVLAVCAALALGVSACGGSSEETPADDQQVEDVVPTDDEAEAPVDDEAEAPVDDEADAPADGEEEVPADGQEEVAE